MSNFQSAGSAMPLYDTVEYHDGVTDTATLHEDLGGASPFGLGSTASFDPQAAIQARIETDAKFRRFIKPIILVLSGLLLGIVGAIIASQTTEQTQQHVATASTFTVNKTIVSAPGSSEQGADSVVLVDSRVQELGQWFEEQPVPVKERVFLHQADKHLKVQKVGYTAPQAVISSYENAKKPVIETAKRTDGGRYLAGSKGSRIEWQGAWKVNAPAKNAATAEKYLSDLEGRFGSESTEKLEIIKRPAEDFVKGSTQRSFGPKVN